MISQTSFKKNWIPQKSFSLKTEEVKLGTVSTASEVLVSKFVYPPWIGGSRSFELKWGRPWSGPSSKFIKKNIFFLKSILGTNNFVFVVVRDSKTNAPVWSINNQSILNMPISNLEKIPLEGKSGFWHPHGGDNGELGG